MKSALRYGWSYVTSPARLLSTPSLPTNLNLPITDNCNSRCIMCDIWKERAEGEISVEQIRDVLKDPLFKKIQHVGISGGEPTLRRELVEFVRVILDVLPSLASLSITSHGFHVRRWEKVMPEIVSSCRTAGVRFTLNLSVDGVDCVHDEVRRIPGGFSRVMETAAIAQRLGVALQFHSTIVRPNVFNVNSLVRLARRNAVTPQFRIGTTIARLGNEASMMTSELSADERSFFSDFLRSAYLHQSTVNPGRRLFYRELADRVVSGAPRRAPCYYQNEGVVLSANGDLHHCSISGEPFGNVFRGSALKQYRSERSVQIRSRIKSDLCPGCLHDQSGAWSPLKVAGEIIRPTRLGRSATLVNRALMFAGRLLSSMFRLPLALTRVRAGRGSELPVRRVVLIGAYGGEHVGDAAILGGVVERLEARYGVTSAVIVSERPDRTTMWASGLSTNVRLTSCSSSSSEVCRQIAEADALVYAGGPIMEMPEKVVQHLRAAVEAACMGKPFYVEGVGVGPFKTRIVKFLSRMLLKLADSVVVRSSADALEPVMQGIRSEVKQDPAFDYLASRRGAAMKVRPSARKAIDSAFDVPSNVTVVGINLRPLWSKYVRAAKGAARLEEHLLAEVSEAMQNICSARVGGTADVRFVFIPMNADHYGFSDLEIAGRLQDVLPASVPFQILEHELLVDEAIEALSRCTAVVAMRFHAAIFSLSQGVPTVGIDYAAGVGRGKVSTLFTERGLAGQVANITSVTASWLSSQVMRAASSWQAAL